LKITIVSSWLPTRNDPSFSPYVYSFAENLGRFGFDVSVISPLEEGDESVTSKEFMTIYRVNKKLPIFPIYRLIGKIKPDIIHVHAPNFFSSSAIVAAKLRRIPIIATVHRAEIDKLGNPMFFLRKHTLGRFQRVIAVSDYTKSLALKAGVNENKICVIHNSCNEEIFCRKDKALARINHKLPTEKKIILFVGNLIKIKGVYILIESIKILIRLIPDLLLLIVGQGEERQELELLATKSQLEDHIMFLGWLPQKDLSEIYNAADVFVLPSMTEGHSVALLEAMAVGLPVVASKIGGNLETIEDAINGFLFETGRADKLAERLATIFTDTKLRQRMSAKSAKAYREKFSTKNQINNHLKIYESIIQSNKK
jgi:glycosyltransferase involved in cell wall biosynthesis